jgi:hypothetical protein
MAVRAEKAFYVRNVLKYRTARIQNHASNCIRTRKFNTEDVGEVRTWRKILIT